MCIKDSECSYLYTCDLTNNECVHEPLWPPEFLVVLAFILLPILIGIGNVGGLGGGITKVPIMMLMLNYSQRVATYQAYCIQFGACISNALLLFFQRHPTRDRPLIDFNVGLILVPVSMLGSTMGIYVNEFVPEIATNLLFIVFLFCVMPYLFNKSMKLRKDEDEQNRIKNESAINERSATILDSQIREKMNQNEYKSVDKIQAQSTEITTESNDNDEAYDAPKIVIEYNNNPDTKLVVSDRKTSLLQKPLLSKPNNDSNAMFQSDFYDDPEVEVSPELQAIYNLEKQKIPFLKFTIITFSFVIVQVLNLIVGTKSINSIFGYSRCSAGFWIFTILTPLSIFGLNFIAFLMLRKEQFIKDKYGYNYDPEDIKFTNGNFAKFWAAGFCSGFLAGALGAGGGLSLVTFLMAMQLKSRVASATTGMNNLFIGMTSILSVIMNSSIPAGQVYLFTGVSFLGGFGISKVIYYFVQKYNRVSMVVMFVFAFCIVNIVSNIAYLVKKEVEEGWAPLLSTQSFC